MASTARAYYYEPERLRAPRPSRPDVRVVPGGKPHEQARVQTSTLLLAARVLAVVFVLAALLGIAVISLNAATVRETVTTGELSEAITKARTQGNVLEVQKGSLDSTARIKQIATEMGMAAPASFDLVVLDADIVATDDAGNLSFARSVERASQPKA